MGVDCPYGSPHLSKMQLIIGRLEAGMTVCSDHGQENCSACAVVCIDLPDTFCEAPKRNKEDTWMWHYRGHGRIRTYHYVYRSADGTEISALAFLQEFQEQKAPLATLDHIVVRKGPRHTTKRVARCRVKGKNRSRREERRKARQELRALDV